MKKILSLVFVAMFLLAGCSTGVTTEEYNAVIAERDKYLSQLQEKQADYDEVKAENDSNIKKLEDLTKERDELQSKVDSASAWFSLSEEEQTDMLVVLAERDAAAKAQAEKEAQQGYNTGITYDQLARTPDDYNGKKLKFTGRVLQVIEGSGTTMLRVATKGRYDNVLLVEYDSSIVTTRVLEDDKITLFGVSQGLYTYSSTGGGDITIPYVLIDQIEIVN